MTSHFFHGKEDFQKRIQQYHNSLSCMFADALIEGCRQIVIWLGDFNSRIEYCSKSNENMIEQLNRINPETKDGRLKIKDLIEKFDQLKLAKKAKKAFVEFEESKINFLPSYRILVFIFILLNSKKIKILKFSGWKGRI